MYGEVVLVWAPNPIAALGNVTGFVEVERELAQALIEADAVQDPRHGANHLREISTTPLEPPPVEPPPSPPPAARTAPRKAPK